MSLTDFRLEDEVYGRFRDLVQERSGLYFPDKKRRDLELALSKALAGTPATITEAENYYRYLHVATTPEARQEMARFINLLTIRETHLFRDNAQFEALTTQVLPALIARKREMAAMAGPAVPPQLRLWSAGCSTGEEAYSLAILLRELIPDIDKWRILILATDINEELLAQARQATYSDWSFRESRAQAMRPLYFTPCGGHRGDGHRSDGHRSDGYELREDVRRMVMFARHNLAADDFPAVPNNTVSMDLILCRNVTIYFAPETTCQLVGRFHQSLVEGGWLVVGHSEPSLATYSAFTGHIIQGTLLYQKQSGRAQIPALPEPAANGDVYEEARLLLSNGRIEPAITLLEKMVTLNAQFAAAHCLLARAHADLGQWQKARTACKNAIAIDPLLPEVYYVLAMIEEHEGRLEPAIENLKKVVYLDRERQTRSGFGPLAYFNLALLYKKRSQADLAQRALRTFIHRTRSLPADHILPDSGHTSVQRLSAAARQLLAEIGD